MANKMMRGRDASQKPFSANRLTGEKIDVDGERQKWM